MGNQTISTKKSNNSSLKSSLMQGALESQRDAENYPLGKPSEEAESVSDLHPVHAGFQITSMIYKNRVYLGIVCARKSAVGEVRKLVRSVVEDALPFHMTVNGDYASLLINLRKKKFLIFMIVIFASLGLTQSPIISNLMSLL